LGSRSSGHTLVSLKNESFRSLRLKEFRRLKSERVSLFFLKNKILSASTFRILRLRELVLPGNRDYQNAELFESSRALKLQGLGLL
jgi:hypothetical protein